METKQIIETSQALQKVYLDYFNLTLGNRKIPCPYWINNPKRLKFGPGGGKSLPEEIVILAQQKAIQDKVDLAKLSEKEIINFLKKNHLGIDCSGFAFWLLDALDQEKGGNGIIDDIPNVEGKIIKVRASVKMLTDSQVAYPIKSLNEIKPGDMIRLRAGHHLLIVLQTQKDQNKNLKKIIYVHSSSSVFTKTSGVHQQEILITNPNKPIEDQNWLEQTVNGLSYAKELLRSEGDGIFRLKIWQ